MRNQSIILFLLFFLSYNSVFSQARRDTSDFNLFDVNGNKVKLSDYKGKVLYIGFWASWCGGCKLFLKLGNELHAKFNEEELKKIVFIHISIDNDKEVWKKAMKENQVQGLQFISSMLDTNSASQYFRVTGLTRYVIYNKKGQVTSWIAKNPYQTEVYEELCGLIEEKD